MKKLQLYGLFRTGTNYITHLIEDNFFAKIYKHGEKGLNYKGFCTNWKHGPYVGNLLKEEYPMIIVTKNPYSWLTSCYKYWKKFPIGPKLDKFTFEEFVKTTPCKLEGSATVPFMFRSKNIMQYYWNAYYHWLSVRSTEQILIRYEDVMNNPEETLTKALYNIEKKKKFKNIENNVLWDVRDDDKKFKLKNHPSAREYREKKFNPNFYRNKIYLDQFSDDLLKFVEKEWDDEVANKLKYEIEKPKFLEKIILSITPPSLAAG